MKSMHSMVISMRLPAASGKRLKRMANRHGWTASDASARLVEEGLRRSEFGFIDFRDSPAGRQACLQGSTLGVWEVMLLLTAIRKMWPRWRGILNGRKRKFRPRSTTQPRSPKKSMKRYQDNQDDGF